MQMYCPRCRCELESNQVNLERDSGYCPECNETFCISQHFIDCRVDKELLDRPPRGTWFREETRGIVVGAKLYSSFSIVSFVFMLVFGSIAYFAITRHQGDYNSREVIGYGMFLIVSIGLVGLTLVSVFGKTEVVIGGENTIYTGLGPLGLVSNFNWSCVKEIKLADSRFGGSGEPMKGIVLCGQSEQMFGVLLGEKRKAYVLNVLRYLKHGERNRPILR